MSTSTEKINLSEAFPNSSYEWIQNLPQKSANVTGVSSSALLASSLASSFLNEKKQHFVIFPNESDVKTFLQWLSFFQPNLPVFNLPSYDVSPYMGIMPNPSISAQRMGWLTQSQIQEKGIFICNINALTKKTLPAEAVVDHIYFLEEGTELPESFLSILEKIGYRSVSLVEDIGTFSFRGGILDIFPPSLKKPLRIELFGEEVASLREFDPESQRSLDIIASTHIGPAHEAFYDPEDREEVIQRIKAFESSDKKDFSEPSRTFAKGNLFSGIEFFLPFLHDQLALPQDYLSSQVKTWIYDPIACTQAYDLHLQSLKEDYENGFEKNNNFSPQHLFSHEDLNQSLQAFNPIEFSKIELLEENAEDKKVLHNPIHQISLKDLFHASKDSSKSTIQKKLNEWKEKDYSIFLLYSTEAQKATARILLEDLSFEPIALQGSEKTWKTWLSENQGTKNIFLLSGRAPEDVLFQDEKIVFLQADRVLPRSRGTHKKSAAKDFQQKASALSFGDLKEGDLIVHSEHGVGIYQGLEVMSIGGADSEFIRLEYKGKDKLFIPVYRVHQIQKYSGPKSERLLDKLGNNSWQNTKVKVRAKLRDVASDLLQIYVKRSQVQRPAFSDGGDDLQRFERLFPFQETNDQAKAIDQVLGDMTSGKPMDRLICGDVGFGKTEVAMRAAFKAVQDGKQVAVLAPTTVLTYQHFENFKKRFAHEEKNIRVLNRFLERKEAKEVVEQIRSGAIDIVIGTHRLLSKDIDFKRLGLLIIDEEQKFGVMHKERIRKMKAHVDTLALSATPIPRTLNMSLMGIRDLSLITTAPVDRLPTRTFICKNHIGTIQKSIRTEIQRGGQSFFLHNRVQSIYGVYEELKAAVPEARFAVAHGQMSENELEKVVVDFFNHKIDVLVCTTIIESGIDIPKANTIFIDKAHTFGLSQLYQLRGRVGRGRQRAYCYLLLPKTGGIDKDAQERLKIIQENTALGSGIKIAHYDLELRGSGNILGEDQSGHINAVGYELYLELFEKALREARGEEAKESLEPDINVRIPAFIPDQYIKDIRTRLSYYKTLSQISSIEDVDKIEDELRDLFGKPPQQTVNLLGLMLIRLTCKNLAIKDLSSGASSISLSFTDKTPLPAAKVVELTMQTNKKYSFTPDNRLKVRMKEITWQRIFEELKILESIES